MSPSSSPLLPEHPSSPRSPLPLLASPFHHLSQPLSNSPSPQPPTQPPTTTNSTRPPFNPLFTLITDNKTSTTHHPSKIHYIFSDDDPSLLTSACLASLANSTELLSGSPTSSTHGAPAPTSKLATPQGRENRVLVLDVSESGTSITAAHSLTSSWQILSTSLTPAPMLDESPSPSEAEGEEQERAKGLMLRIEGTEGEGAVKGVGGAGKNGGEDLVGLMDDFERRMVTLRTVVEAGIERDGKTRISLERDEDDEDDKGYEPDEKGE